MIDLSKSLFLVDGISEIRSFKAKFQKDFGIIPGFRCVGCNGKQVVAKGYANKAVPIILVALSSAYKFIICVLDREKRAVNSSNFRKDVEKELKNQLKKTTSLSRDDIDKLLMVSVSDIMFENWIVADIEGIKTRDTLICQETVQGYYDGRSGSTI